MHLSFVKPQGEGGGGYQWEIDLASFSLGGDFDIWVLPWGREFDIAKTCFGQKVAPWGGNLTLLRSVLGKKRHPGVGIRHFLGAQGWRI